MVYDSTWHYGTWYITYGSTWQQDFTQRQSNTFPEPLSFVKDLHKKETHKESLFPEYTMTRSQSPAVEAFFPQTVKHVFLDLSDASFVLMPMSQV